MDISILINFPKLLVYLHLTSSGKHICHDRKTVINIDQICDGVDDCPVTDYYLIAQDENHMCPGQILVSFFTI